MKEPYERLAPFYDGMARDPALRRLYRSWHRSVQDAARQRGVRPAVIVDLACGTGNATIPWVRPGRTVIGVDRSPAMLSVARSKSCAVRWVRQDMRRLRLDVHADVVTCHFDALNHVLEARDVERIFERVAGTLKPGGLFQFDLNTVHMLRWLHQREKLFSVGPHWFVASNRYDETRGIATFHQHWFVKAARPAGRPAGDGRSRAPQRFERFLVTVKERAFTDAAIRAMLARSGMTLRRVETVVETDGKPMRKLYLAERPAGRAGTARSPRSTGPETGRRPEAAARRPFARGKCPI